jgi:hypothetical protein
MKAFVIKRFSIEPVFLAILVAAFSGTTYSQTGISPRAGVGAPDIFKVIAEGQEQRVMEGTLNPGQKTPSLSYPAGTVVYYLTNCNLKVTEFGVDVDTYPTAGSARIITPAINNQTRQNVGKSACRFVIVERQ